MIKHSRNISKKMLGKQVLEPEVSCPICGRTDHKFTSIAIAMYQNPMVYAGINLFLRGRMDSYEEALTLIVLHLAEVNSTYLEQLTEYKANGTPKMVFPSES